MRIIFGQVVFYPQQLETSTEVLSSCMLGLKEIRKRTVLHRAPDRDKVNTPISRNHLQMIFCGFD